MPKLAQNRLLRPLVWVFVPLLAATAAMIEPLFGNGLPSLVQRPFGPETPPLPLLPMLMLITILTVLAMRFIGRVASLATVAMFCLLAASQLNGIGFGPLDTFDFALFGAFLCWAATLALDPTRPIRFGFLLSMALLIGVLALAHLPVMRPRAWIIGMIGVIRISLIALLVVDLCRDQASLRRTINLFIIVAVVSAIIGIAQFFLALTGIWVFTFINPPESAFKPTPIGFVMRASALCITAQHFSSFLVYALPFALWRLTTRPSLTATAAAVALLAGVVVSWNTGAIFAAALVMLAFPFFRWPERTAALAVVLTAGLSIAYFSGFLQLIYDVTFGDSGVSKGIDQRKTLFALGIDEIAANPFVGTGLAGFDTVDGNFWGRPVHNAFAQAATELGVLGLGTMIALFTVPMVYLSDHMFSADPSGLSRCAFLAILAALLLAQSEPNLDQSNLWLLLALAQATILSNRQDESRSQTTKNIC